MGCIRIMLETDSTVLKQALISDAYDDSVLGALFKEMKMFLRYSFQSYKISVCPRTCNTLAHNFAAIGFSLKEGNHRCG